MFRPFKVLGCFLGEQSIAMVKAFGKNSNFVVPHYEVLKTLSSKYEVNLVNSLGGKRTKYFLPPASRRRCHYNINDCPCLQPKTHQMNQILTRYDHVGQVTAAFVINETSNVKKNYICVVLTKSTSPQQWHSATTHKFHIFKSWRLNTLPSKYKVDTEEKKHKERKTQIMKHWFHVASKWCYHSDEK